MKEKDFMKHITGILDNLSDDEKAKRARSLKKLMDDELARRKANPKKPKKD